MKENRYLVDPPYWGRAFFLTMLSLANSYHKRKDDQLFGTELMKTEVKDPIFIIGHWRSGTTLLHYLMSKDEQFGYPTIFQVSNPHTFLVREKLVPNQSSHQKKYKRPMDGIIITPDSPGEDEFAISVMCLRSPIIGWSFPRREAYYDKFLSFKEVSARETEIWKEALIYFYKKLTFRHKKPLLIKSPAHTARIRLLIDMFPEARFVHIHRDPYRVFQSTQKLYKTAIPFSNLQRPYDNTLTEGILRRYADMYDSFFEDISRLGDNRYIDITYEEFIKEMVGTIEMIYEKLELAGFSDIKSSLNEYVNSIANYRNNTYDPIPEPIRIKIAKLWEQPFNKWDY